MNNSVIRSVDFLKSKGIRSLSGAISTGSGQHLRLESFRTVLETSYKEIPNLGDIEIPGHEGTLRVIESGRGFWAMWVGRRHFYQGFDFNEIGFYIEISRALGATDLICINAAGGLNPSYDVNDLVVIDRFKNFIPIAGYEYRPDGSPWREMSESLVNRLTAASAEAGIGIKKGAYVGVPGPTYETAAEVEWLRKMGCDVVGMSTVPELIYGLDGGMNAVALSSIANVHGRSDKLSHEEVVRAGSEGLSKIESILKFYLEIR